MNNEKQIDIIRDLLTEFDEMGFIPTTTVPHPEAYAIKWREEITKAIVDYRKQTVGEWISVEDRLPDDGCTYLVVVKLKYEWETEWEYHVDAGALVFCNGYIDGIWDTANDWDEGQECHITHWMPLPEPPKLQDANAPGYS